MPGLREQLKKFSDRQLVAFWNVLQESGDTGEYASLADELLAGRGIAHERDKLTGFRAGKAVLVDKR